MRRTLRLLATMALALLMASSVALALNRISCGGGLCEGTNEADSMSGTEGSDQMYGEPGSSTSGEDDKLNGYGGDDSLYGEWGNDTSNGGAGEDYFSDYYGTNTLNGGAGNDVFNADYGDVTGEVSKVRGGSGNDRAWSFDRTKDTINCGPGTDVVYDHDSGLDTLRGCELDGNGMPLP